MDYGSINEEGDTNKDGFDNNGDPKKWTLFIWVYITWWWFIKIIVVLSYSIIKGYIELYNLYKIKINFWYQHE